LVVLALLWQLAAFTTGKTALLVLSVFCVLWLLTLHAVVRAIPAVAASRVFCRWQQLKTWVFGVVGGVALGVLSNAAYDLIK
ncbi:MAG: hypothetical protein ABIZ80_05720, partial [Bryobacteraceae bacterium]